MLPENPAPLLQRGKVKGDLSFEWARLQRSVVHSVGSAGRRRDGDDVAKGWWCPFHPFPPGAGWASAPPRCWRSRTWRAVECFMFSARISSARGSARKPPSTDSGQVPAGRAPGPLPLPPPPAVSPQGQERTTGAPLYQNSGTELEEWRSLLSTESSTYGLASPLEAASFSHLCAVFSRERSNFNLIKSTESSLPCCPSSQKEDIPQVVKPTSVILKAERRRHFQKSPYTYRK